MNRRRMLQYALGTLLTAGTGAVGAYVYMQHDDSSRDTPTPLYTPPPEGAPPPPSLTDIAPDADILNRIVLVGPDHIPFGLLVHDDHIAMHLDGELYPVLTVDGNEVTEDIRTSIQLTRTPNGISGSCIPEGWWRMGKEICDESLTEGLSSGRECIEERMQSGAEKAMLRFEKPGTNTVHLLVIKLPESAPVQLAQH